MLDDATTGAAPAAPRCNWCSAVLPSDHETTCPSCGATLVADGEASVPGLTAIDAEAILRNARNAKAKPRSRLLGWISGDYDAGDEPAPPPGSLAPPDEAVRREMLRLELEAQVANAEAEVGAMAADAAVEEGRSLAPVDAVSAESAQGSAGDRPGSTEDPAAESVAAPGADAADDHGEAPPA
jgi:hypothetical protein